MRSLRLVLAAAMALTLVACSDDDGETTNNNNSNHHLYQDSAVQQDSNQPQPDSSQPQPDSSQPQPDANTQPGNGITGDPCVNANQCGGITNGTPECLTSLMYVLTFPGGYCSSQTCTAGTACDNGTGICVSLTLGSACLQACTAATECRQNEGYDCTTIPYIGGSETYCLKGGGMGLPDGGFGFGDGGFGLGDGGLPF